MRARESFELIRNKKIKLSLRTRMTLYVAAEILKNNEPETPARGNGRFLT